MLSYAKDKQAILARLRRIEGQLKGIQRMVEEDKYCFFRLWPEVSKDFMFTAFSLSGRILNYLPPDPRGKS